MTFDVVSLFTNVPEYLEYEAIERRWQQIHNKINTTCTEFLKVIKFIINNNYFQFNGNFYRQTFGSAMGNPLSPILSNIVMEDLENSCINKLQEKPLFYYRYVNDIVLCIPKNIRDTLQIFNS